MAVTAVAQEAKGGFTVKGMVADSLTNEGEPYATIKITAKGKPDETVRMGVTLKSGRFAETLPSAGEYTLTVSSMGRKPLTRDFKVSDDSKAIDLGSLLVSDADNSLSGVEVVAQKPLVKSDIDKLEYNIEEDPESKSSTVIEMLRKVPLVTVDGQDNIMVNGSSNFKVYVNGKPNNMMSKNPSEVLKSMPASSIKRIEVITNPGPKYDAEGVGGILNIITTGGGMEGYSVTVGAKARNTGGGGNIYATVKKGKLTMSASYNYNSNDQPRGYERQERTATDASDASTANVVANGSGKNRGDFQSGSFEASYEIDSLRLVTASLSAWGGNNKTRSYNDCTATSPLSGDALYRYNAISASKFKWLSLDGSIDYQRSFSVKDRLLTLSYKISSEPEDEGEDVYYNDAWATADWQSFVNRLMNQRKDGDENTLEQTFQLDYTTPIGKLHTIEMGAKYIMRDNKSNTDHYTRTDESTADYAFDEDNSSHYRHNNDIIAAYLGYGLKLNKLTGRAGLRYEHTIQDVKYLIGQGANFRRHFNDLVPSVSLGYKFNDETNVRLGYGLRIYRPGIYYLDPFVEDCDPNEIRQGNSQLDNEKQHKIDFGFNHITSKLTLNLTLIHSFVRNGIESYSAIVNDNDIVGMKNPTGKNVLYSSYRNMGRNRQTALSGYFSWNVAKNMRFYANFNGSYRHFFDGISQKSHGWQGNIYCGIDQSFKYDWRITVQYFGMTPSVTSQGRSNSFSSYGVSVTKQFMQKRLTLNAFAGDFFKKYHTYEGHTEGAGFYQKGAYRFSTMRYGISVSYRFGELKASVKKAERTISNDDVKSGGNKGGN